MSNSTTPAAPNCSACGSVMDVDWFAGCLTAQCPNCD